MQALLMSRFGVGTQIITSASFCQAKKVSRICPFSRVKFSLRLSVAGAVKLLVRELVLEGEEKLSHCVGSLST